MSGRGCIKAQCKTWGERREDREEEGRGRAFQVWEMDLGLEALDEFLSNHLQEGRAEFESNIQLWYVGFWHAEKMGLETLQSHLVNAHVFLPG